MSAAELVVLTRTPGAWCEPGTIYQWREGHPWYRITTGKWKHGTFEVYGERTEPPPFSEQHPPFSYVLHLGDLAAGETRRVPLDGIGWRWVVRSDPNPFPRMRLFGRRSGAGVTL